MEESWETPPLQNHRTPTGVHHDLGCHGRKPDAWSSSAGNVCPLGLCSPSCGHQPRPSLCKLSTWFSAADMVIQSHTSCLALVSIKN